jgi:bis(5'-adenosyl)-triphosphatase
MRLPSCPFCRPAIEESAFAQSEHFLAIYNKSPILPGHSLVIPRQHVPAVLALSGPELTEFMHFARRVTEGLLRIFGANAFNWSIQEQPAAGQTVNHLHLHIVPRLENDLPEPGDWYPILLKSYQTEVIDSNTRPRLTDEEVKQEAQRIRSLLEGKEEGSGGVG